VLRNGKCKRHYLQADKARGTAAQRGYDRDHRELFRDPVLKRAAFVCAIDGCPMPATVADHHPRTRKQIVAEGDDPNNPDYGRALCQRHHDQHTAAASKLGHYSRNATT
jgi:5-methylcytosine-specific restriction protein A